MEFALDEWLVNHSTRTERIGQEIVFTHFTGETSILIPRTEAPGARIDVESRYLNAFFKNMLRQALVTHNYSLQRLW